MNIVRIIFNLLRFDRANWKAVSLCIVAAVVFWIFNAFNKTYSTTIKFPVQFEFDNKTYTPAAELPTKLNVSVSGNGWEIFWNHVGLKIPKITSKFN